MNIFTWCLFLMGIWVALTHWVLLVACGDSHDYKIFLKGSMPVRGSIALLALGCIALTSVVWYNSEEQKQAEQRKASAEKMAKLPAAFRKNGTVTAGNASGINDAAAALLLMSDTKAKQLGLKPLVKIRAYASGGVDPAFMGLGPIPAVRKILQREKLTINDFGAIELNEAFASQAIACMRELKCDMEKTNTLGSGISIGHPVGCTGARIILTLMSEMIRKDHALGLATLCIGGGQGMGTVLERV